MVQELTVQFTLFIVFTAALLFWPAGWRGAWILLGDARFGIAVSLWLLCYNPQLLRERMGSPFRKKQAWWDKIFMLFLLLGGAAFSC